MRPRNHLAAGYDRRQRMEFCPRSYRPGSRRSTRIFQHDPFAEKKPIVEVDRDRLIRYDRTDGMRPPHGYAVCRKFFKRLNLVDSWFFHADRRDLAATASTRKGFGIKRQISAVFGNVGGRFRRYTNHGFLRLDGWALRSPGLNRFRILALRICPRSLGCGISMRPKTARSKPRPATLRR